MITLFIKNLTKANADKKLLRQVAEKSFKNLPKLKKNNKRVQIDLVVIGENRMKRLNRVWRGKDKATDVLSFGSADGRTKEHALKNGFKFIFPPDDIIHLGQIFICYPVMSRQAKQYGYSLRQEMARLLVHGILHLAGYDHEKSAGEEKKMFALQEKILRKI